MKAMKVLMKPLPMSEINAKTKAVFTVQTPVNKAPRGFGVLPANPYLCRPAKMAFFHQI